MPDFLEIELNVLLWIRRSKEDINGSNPIVINDLDAGQAISVLPHFTQSEIFKKKDIGGKIRQTDPFP
ncbi:hypothetical protein [uncultured Gimesia sp.]|uniref:hypothetical protein n=1 Tax=uncultured Gimesia sp. TaxID=1678688 RepID=UPI0026359365|nr:hypothetical protein [uncultured Gimesia sp.]